MAAAVRRAVSWSAGRGDYTYRRVSRRNTAGAGVVFPGRQRAVPRVAIVLDTSGSVDDALLELALSELDQLLTSLNLNDTGVPVYSVDTAAHLTKGIRRATDIVLLGAGGTDMRVGLVAATLANPKPDVIVVFTDGYTPWPDQAPQGCSVVIAVIGSRGASMPDTPDWATRVECRIDR